MKRELPTPQHTLDTLWQIVTSPDQINHKQDGGAYQALLEAVWDLVEFQGLIPCNFEQTDDVKNALVKKIKAAHEAEEQKQPRTQLPTTMQELTAPSAQVNASSLQTGGVAADQAKSGEIKR